MALMNASWLEKYSGAVRAMRSAPGQLQAIAPPNAEWTVQALRDGLGVIYLAAREGVGPHRATTRDDGARFFRYIGA